MSISVEKLSLLESLIPLRNSASVTSAAPNNSFAEKLDKVLGSGEVFAATGSDQAREMAETLSLQMLHSSLSLSGDSSGDDNAVLHSTTSLAAKALQRAYQSASDTGRTEQAPVPVSRSPQLQELSKDLSIASVSPNISKADSGWLEPVILKASSKYGVDSGLIRAVIKAESDFNPRAVSHAGARGLMQLMPATASSLGVKDSFDPEQNVMGGTRFLKDMLQRYNGNVDSALAAYNWGPGNVDRNPDRLPRETRNYLARVKQLYEAYSA